MAANNPLTTAPSVTSTIPSGFLPSGTSGVTVIPIPIIWDPNYVDGSGNTGGWRPLYGIEGAGMGAVPYNSSGTELFTAGNPAQVAVATLPALAAGTNAIGSVTVTALPALSAGTNAIGDVGVTSLPALPTGTNTIGTVNVGTLPNVTVGAPLPAGTNAIGTVGVTALPALPTGTNTIGSVTQNGTPLKAANKVTCSSTDANVAPTNGFNHISIKNLDATNEIVLAIDADSTTATELIYLEAGEAFEDYLSGSALHYSAATGSPILKYVLR